MVRFSEALAGTATLLFAFTPVQGQYVNVQGLQNGVNTATGARPARQNINTLANSGPAWDLYIQGLAAWQAEGQTDTTSYYQVAGIHGRPYAPWDNVNGPNGDYYTGYCTHDSILFPVWHRPYMALFEQELYNFVQSAAAKYTGSNAATYQAAASTWRIPYWDWAASPQMPASITTPSLKINGPSGPITVANPLYNYTFHPLMTSDFPPNAGDAPSSIITAPVTYRNANNRGVPGNTYINQQLSTAGLTQATYDLFTRITDYSNFSTQANSGSSLESVHGTVHVTVGQSNGHMTYIPYSAFDPVFFLHHAQVDRLFAMWQAIYPDQYVVPQANNYGTFTEGGGTIEDENSNLTPFTSSSDGSSFWTSATSRNLSAWGYTYPEINDWSQTPAQLAASVRRSVNNLYNAGSQNSGRKSSRFSARSPDAAWPTLPMTTAWYASVAIDKFACNGPFKVLFFDGAPPTDTSTWSTAPNMIAVQGYFSPVVPSGSMKPQIIYSQVNLAKAFTSQPMGPLAAIAYLTKNLQWGVQKIDGTVVPNEEIPSLNIQVQAVPMKPTTNPDLFPEFGKLIHHHKITAGKPGGCDWN